jgi:hypothetical protein
MSPSYNFLMKAGIGYLVRITATVLLFCFTLSLCRSEIAPFTAEGIILTETFKAASGPAPASSFEEAVTFSYSNRWWRIELRHKSGFHPKIPPSALEGKIDNCETISGGVRVLTSYVSLPKPEAWLSAHAYPTEFPPPDRVNLLTCWLTLCPNPSLPILGNGLIRRLISSDFMTSAENQGLYSASYLVGNNFLAQLSITNNGTIPDSESTTRKLIAPFDEGHLELEYTLLASTNWQGLEFPLKSTLRKFVPRRDGTDKSSIFECLTSRLWVNSFRPETSAPQVDPRKLRVIVSDGRVADVPKGKSIQYAITNDHWMDPTNPTLIQMARAKFADPSEPIPKPRKRRSKITAVLIAMVLGPAVGLLLYIQDKKNRKLQKSNETKPES